MPVTIQRDPLLLKEAVFPLRELRKGTHALNKAILKNLEAFDDVSLEPYRIAYYQGFWYPVGLDCDANTCRRRAPSGR